MKNKIFILQLLICVILCNCKKDTESIYLSSASHIDAEINMTKSIDKNSVLSSDISVGIENSNGQSVEIKNGWVKLNGIALEITKRNYRNITYYFYSAKNIIEKIEPNKLYSFEIRLSDGTIYNSSIITQDKDLYELILPNSQSRDSDLKFSWKDIDLLNTIDIYFYRLSNTDTMSMAIYEPQYSDKQSGSFIIPKDQLSDSRLNNVIVKILSTKRGTMDSKLAGDFYSYFQIEKYCNIQ